MAHSKHSKAYGTRAEKCGDPIAPSRQSITYVPAARYKPVGWLPLTRTEHPYGVA
jgi:hypothetical protein